MLCTSPIQNISNVQVILQPSCHFTLLLRVHTGVDQVVVVDSTQQEQKKQLTNIMSFVQFNDQVCLVAPSLGVVSLPGWSSTSFRVSLYIGVAYHGLVSEKW